MAAPTASTPKSLLPIILDSGADNWQMGTRNGDKDYIKVRDEIAIRDGKSCAYCGFKSATGSKSKVTNSGLEVNFLDNDGSNMKPDNMVSCCNLCKQCFNLSYAGSEEKAILAYIPELSQAELNNLIRSCMCIEYYVATRKEKLRKDVENVDDMDEIKALMPALNAAQSLFAAFKARSAFAEKILSTYRAEEIGQAIETIKKGANAAKLTKGGLEAELEGAVREGRMTEEKRRELSALNQNDAMSAMRDALTGIRLVATQPGCDPRAWVPPVGSYLTTLPQHWLRMYTRISKDVDKIIGADYRSAKPIEGKTIMKDLERKNEAAKAKEAEQAKENALAQKSQPKTKS